MMNETFESMLTGGHPNSLGRTVDVVEIVLSDPTQLEKLYNCYFSSDEVVRLRTSSALKRVCQARPKWLIPYIDRLINEISKIDQASTQWTLAILFDTLTPEMSDQQFTAALNILKHNMATHNDWIVLNTTMQTLANWAEKNPSLQSWLIPHLKRLTNDGRKSVSKRTTKLLGRFSPNEQL